MLSNFFRIITNREDFKNHLDSLIDSLKGKKVLIYGAGSGFVELNKTYNFAEKLDIVGISDKRFEKENPGTFLSIKTILPDEISKEKFDHILVTNERSKAIVFSLKYWTAKQDGVVIPIFDYEDEDINIVNYLGLLKLNQKGLDKLDKKLKNKSIIIYADKKTFSWIVKLFDLKKFDVQAVTHKKFETDNVNGELDGYKVCKPEEIPSLKPDYVVAASFYRIVDTILDIKHDYLKGTKIKLIPLARKPFSEILEECFYREV